MNITKMPMSPSEVDFEVATRVPFRGQELILSRPFEAALDRRSGSLAERVGAAARPLSKSRLLALLPSPAARNERVQATLQFTLLLPTRTLVVDDLGALEALLASGEEWKPADIEQAAASCAVIRTRHWVYALGSVGSDGFGLHAPTSPTHVPVVRPAERQAQLDVMPSTPATGYAAPNALLFCREL